MLFVKTDTTSLRDLSVKCLVLGSATRSITATAKRLLNTATAWMASLQPVTPNTVVVAKLVATRPNNAWQVTPTKRHAPNANPRFDGGVSSAVRLQPTGSTTPNAIPLSIRPMKIMSNDHATEQSTNPTDQNNMPKPMSNGRLNLSPKKPLTNADKATTAPFVIVKVLKEVCDTPNRPWNSLKKKGKRPESMSTAALHKHMMTSATHFSRTGRIST
mmetsp:Transcript_47120/g.143191  ORF Transcript_47120/g.143191 Transcript_47120/m.143191 type:complete len:216 (-) Transcript_47120:148-795(-)